MSILDSSIFDRARRKIRRAGRDILNSVVNGAEVAQDRIVSDIARSPRGARVIAENRESDLSVSAKKILPILAIISGALLLGKILK